MEQSLYRRLLGKAYSSLPLSVQEMHDVSGELTAEGVAKVDRGRGLAVALIGWIFGFPEAGDNVPVTVTFTGTPDRELWDRRFDGKQFFSTQELGRGRHEGMLIERFGPWAFALDAPVRDRQLHLTLKAGWFLGVPLPRFVLPRIEVFEHEDAARFHFHVDLGLPFVGRLVRYRGWLVPAPSGIGEAEGQKL